MSGLKETWITGSIYTTMSYGKVFQTVVEPRIDVDGLGCLYKVMGRGDDGLGYRYYTGPQRATAKKGKMFSGVPLEKVEDFKNGTAPKKKIPIITTYDFSADFGNIRHEGGVAFSSIRNHQTIGKPHTLEGKIVRLSDKIAYIHHDMDDAIRGGILTEADVPKDICEVIGSSPTERLDHFIHDIVTNSMDKGDILMSEPVAEAMTKIRQFMFERVYKNPVAKSEEGKAEMLMETLYQHFLKHLDDLPEEYLNLLSVGEPREKVVCDYVGAMTDRFAIAVYEDIYIPKSWQR